MKRLELTLVAAALAALSLAAASASAQGAAERQAAAELSLTPPRLRQDHHIERCQPLLGCHGVQGTEYSLTFSCYLSSTAMIT